MRSLCLLNPRNATLYRIGLGSIGLLGIVTAIFYSLTVAINLSVTHIDGAFQTASGLFRLQSGQLPGRDFFPYLGIGPLYILYPFFLLSGSNMAASVFATHFTVLVTQGFCVAVIHFFIWRPKSVVTSAGIGVIFFLAVLGLNDALPAWLIERFIPGNSLKPLRSTIPFIAIALVYCSFRYVQQDGYFNLIVGAISGVATIWSNDFGVLTMVSIVGLGLTISVIRRRVSIWSVGTLLGGAFISTFVFWGVSTGGHPLELVRYNFFDVGRDQWWYFGPWSYESRVFTIEEIVKLIDAQTIFPLAVLCWITVLSIFKRPVEALWPLWLGSVLLLGGMVASIGGHLGAYFEGFYFWGMVTAGFSVLRLLKLLFQRFVAQKIPPWFSYCHPILIVCTVALAGIQLFASLNVWAQAHDEAMTDSDRFYVGELGGYLPVAWKEYVALARNSEATQELEEYWGVWSAIRKPLPLWPVDSVIHALGEVRLKAKKRMEGLPAFVITTRADFSIWQAWNVSQNYWFYRVLLKRYSPVIVSPTTVIWKVNSDGPRVWPAAACHIHESDQTVELYATTAGYYEMSVHYQDFIRRRHLLLVRNNINFALDAGGYLSVDSKAQQATFPVYLANPGLNRLDFKSLPASSSAPISLISCSARKIVFEDSTHILPSQLPVQLSPQFFLESWTRSPDIRWATFLVPNTPLAQYFYLTDKNWYRGVARGWAGFFVPNVSRYSDTYIPGRIVRFRNGEQREILRVAPSDQYLNVFVSGDPLDPLKVGLPSEFVVVDRGNRDLKEGQK